MSDTEKLKVGGYIRVSTSSQVKEGESLNSQRQEIERWVKYNAAELIRIFEDCGKSGASFNRAGFQELKKYAQEKKINKVIMSRLSRFGRNTKELLINMDFFENECGCDLLFLKESIDTSSAVGRLMRTILSALYEFERENSAQQSMETKEYMREKHIPMSVMPVYGFDYKKESENGNKNERTWTVNKEQVKILKEIIVKNILYKNKSLNEVARILNQMNIKTKRGKLWTAMTLSSILKNHQLVGKFYDLKHEYTKNKDRKLIRGKPKPQSEWVLIKEIPGIISQREFDMLQERIRDKRKSVNVKADDPFLLRGLLTCSHCQSKVVPRTTSNNRFYCCYWYGCSQKQRDLSNRKKCLLPYINAQHVEDVMMNFVTNLLLKPSQFFNALLVKGNLQKDINNKLKEIKSIQHNKDKLKKDFDILINSFLKTTTEKGLISSKIKEIEDEIKNCDDKLSSLNTELEELNLNLRNRKVILDKPNDISKFKNLTKDKIIKLSNDDKKFLLSITLAGCKLYLKSVNKSDVVKRRLPIRFNDNLSPTALKQYNTIKDVAFKTTNNRYYSLIQVGSVNVSELINNLTQFINEKIYNKSYKYTPHNIARFNP